MALCFLGLGLISWAPAVALLYAVASGALALWKVTALYAGGASVSSTK